MRSGPALPPRLRVESTQPPLLMSRPERGQILAMGVASRAVEAKDVAPTGVRVFLDARDPRPKAAIRPHVLVALEPAATHLEGGPNKAIHRRPRERDHARAWFADGHDLVRFGDLANPGGESGPRLLRRLRGHCCIVRHQDGFAPPPVHLERPPHGNHRAHHVQRAAAFIQAEVEATVVLLRVRPARRSIRRRVLSIGAKLPQRLE